MNSQAACLSMPHWRFNQACVSHYPAGPDISVGHLYATVIYMAGQRFSPAINSAA